MNPLVYSYFVELLNDAVDKVGIRNWAIYTLAVWVFTYIVWSVDILTIPLIGMGILSLTGVVMGVLFTLSTVVTIWWKYRGREKHTGVSIVDIAEHAKGRDTE